MTTVEMHFEPPGKLLSLNDRMHWAQKARLTKVWRETAYAYGRASNPHGLDQAIVYVSLPVSTRHKRDAHNYIATVKPIVDGLVDAGWWPDDDGEWVAVAEPTLTFGSKIVTVRAVEITT